MEVSEHCGTVGRGRPQVEMCPRPGWRRNAAGAVVVWKAGLGEDLDRLTRLASTGATSNDLCRLLADLDGHFSCVVAGPDLVLATVDRNRSIPLFYGHGPSGLMVGNCARTLSRLMGAPIDPDGLLEVRLAGFATGNKTVVDGLRQLLPGEFLLWRREEQDTSRHRYFRYLPSPDGLADPAALLEELARVTDTVFRTIAENAAGRPIWIPLSGGLDSRLILCKLHELGYPDLHTYSYGVRGNHEARIARTVAARLGVSWEFVPLQSGSYRRFFWSPARDEYWHVGDGLASVPALQDVVALKARAQRGEIPSDAIMMNGQSGDYITGGHVPPALVRTDATDSGVIDAIIAKHFSLRSDLTVAPEIIEPLRGLLHAQLDEIRSARDGEMEAAAVYEAWEWQERQCKYVVNGVRMYDYAGIDWLMPLWNGRYMRFWETVPYPLKLKQQLYRQYLDRWNYAGLFEGFSSPRLPWPGASLAAFPIGVALGKLAGPGAKRWFYRRARYFGHYHFAYGIFGWREFLARADVARNPVSFIAETWADAVQAELAAAR